MRRHQLFEYLRCPFLKLVFVKCCYIPLIHLLLRTPSLLKSHPFFQTTAGSATRSQQSILFLEICDLEKVRSLYALRVGGGWVYLKEKRRKRLQLSHSQNMSLGGMYKTFCEITPLYIHLYIRICSRTCGVLCTCDL